MIRQVRSGLQGPSWPVRLSENGARSETCDHARQVQRGTARSPWRSRQQIGGEWLWNAKFLIGVVTAAMMIERAIDESLDGPRHLYLSLLHPKSIPSSWLARIAGRCWSGGSDEQSPS